MAEDRYERTEIRGTGLVYEIRSGYLRLYDGFSEDYVCITDDELPRLCAKLLKLWYEGGLAM